MKQANVIIADDHPVVYEGLSMLIKRKNVIGKVVHAHHGREVLNILKDNETEFQIIFMDISMPVMDGIEATYEIRKLYPDIKIIGMSQHDDKPRIRQMILNGANSYLLKILSAEIIFHAIDCVLSNKRYFPPEVTDVLLEGKLEKTNIEISARELAVLQALTKGKIIKQIAFDLGIAENSVITYKRRLFAKIGVNSISALVSYALKNNLD